MYYSKTFIYPFAAATCIAIAPVLGWGQSLNLPVLFHSRASFSISLSSLFLASSQSMPYEQICLIYNTYTLT